MRIGVISDTHGNKASIDKAAEAAGAVEMWLHAGDYSRDAEYLADITGQQVIAVTGNCDSWSENKIDEFVTVSGKIIWLTHGHRYQAKERTTELVWWGRQYGVDVIVYGHSHLADISIVNGILVFNPGSTVHPRGGVGKSFGILTIEQGKVSADIVPLM